MTVCFGALVLKQAGTCCHVCVLSALLLVLVVQVFALTVQHSLQADDLCLDVSAVAGDVKLYQCHGLGGNQLWSYSALVCVRARRSSWCMHAGRRYRVVSP